MDWTTMTKWLWRAKRVTTRRYPLHGTDRISGGKLRGRTDTDYFHFDCPECGSSGQELDVEILGIRDDSFDEHPTARTAIFGLSCPACGLRDLVKIGFLESEEYQPRRFEELTGSTN
jgi:hypothetical protein